MRSLRGLLSKTQFGERHLTVRLANNAERRVPSRARFTITQAVDLRLRNPDADTEVGFRHAGFFEEIV